MALTTDSSDHGDIRTGWQQQENATPHIVGDSSGNTRETTFAADAAATSDLLLGKTITVDGAFESTGTTLDLTLAGDQVSTSSYDVDSLLLPVRDFPSVAAGFEEAALDLLQRMYGSGGRPGCRLGGRGRANSGGSHPGTNLQRASVIES